MEGNLSQNMVRTCFKTKNKQRGRRGRGRQPSLSSLLSAAAWLTSSFLDIPDTQTLSLARAEKAQNQPKKLIRLSFKMRETESWDWSSVVEQLPGVYETLGVISSRAKEKK